jgi:hypothetical protein
MNNFSVYLSSLDTAFYILAKVRNICLGTS